MFFLCVCVFVLAFSSFLKVCFLICWVVEFVLKHLFVVQRTCWCSMCVFAVWFVCMLLFRWTFLWHATNHIRCLLDIIQLYIHITSTWHTHTYIYIYSIYSIYVIFIIINLYHLLKDFPFTPLAPLAPRKRQVTGELLEQVRKSEALEAEAAGEVGQRR